MNTKNKGNVSNKRNDWWQKPGLGIQYQIEYRPGWLWLRDFNKFNRSMMDKKGNFKFNGPYCKISEWLELSKKVGVDYHMFESKWHDGIVWFDTALTIWKSPTDYCKEFAELSRKAKIPFIFYYSTIFDHNPQFKKITPLSITCSLPIMSKNNIYKKYLEGQMKELIDKYHPDGIWFDWFLDGLHASENVVVEFLQKYSPGTIFSFNNSNPYKVNHWHSLVSQFPFLLLNTLHNLLFEKGYNKMKAAAQSKKLLDLMNYTSFEAHTVNQAIRRADIYRNFTKPWELVGPAGRGWDNVKLRKDPYDLLRISAIIMANGGKFTVGAASEMNGSIYPEHVKQLALLGKWYKTRKELFREAVPVNANGVAITASAPIKQKFIQFGDKKLVDLGIFGDIVKDVESKGFFSINQYKSDYLIHIFNPGKVPKITLELDNKFWRNIDKIYLEPQHERLQFKKQSLKTIITLPEAILAPVDTILRISIENMGG